jgi:hypothetical protein
MSKKYQILPVKSKQLLSNNWKTVPSYLPRHPFAILCQAPPKSGKTNLCVNMLLNPAFNWLSKFDKVVWISPTILSDKTAKPIVEIANDEENIDSDKIKIFTGDDIDNIDDIIKSIVEDQIENPEHETLIILDDCIGKMKNGEFGKLYAKYRHNNLSLLGISQTFKSFDVISRASASGYILFKTYNQKERGKIIEELSGIPDIENLYDEATDKKHSFLWINVDEQEAWRNFEEKLWAKNED